MLCSGDRDGCQECLLWHTLAWTWTETDEFESRQHCLILTADPCAHKCTLFQAWCPHGTSLHPVPRRACVLMFVTCLRLTWVTAEMLQTQKCFNFRQCMGWTWILSCRTASSLQYKVWLSSDVDELSTSVNIHERCAGSTKSQNFKSIHVHIFHSRLHLFVYIHLPYVFVLCTYVCVSTCKWTPGPLAGATQDKGRECPAANVITAKPWHWNLSVLFVQLQIKL